MSGAAAQPVPSFSDRFAWAIELLFRGLRTSSPRHGPGGHLGVLAWNRLQRLLARFVALAAAIEAGRVPVLRPRASRATASPRPASAPTPAPTARLPGTVGWLLRLAPGLDTRIGRLQLETLLGEPDLAALLAQAPQAGRVLRPLCRMLAIPLPPALRLAPRPRPRRTPAPVPAAEAAASREGETQWVSSVVYVPPWRQGPGAEDEPEPFVPTPRQRELLALLCPPGRRRRTARAGPSED